MTNKLWQLVEDQDLANPFHRTGTDDSKRIGANLPVVQVGLVDAALRAIAPQGRWSAEGSTHCLLLAPYGGGKSSALRGIYQLCSDEKGQPALVKLEAESFKLALKQSAEKCAEQILVDVIHEFSKLLAKKRKQAQTYADAVNERAAKLFDTMEGVEIPRAMAHLARHVRKELKTFGVVLLDELEALLLADDIRMENRLQLLEIIKNWCEETDSTISLALAGTNAVLDLLRERVPKILDGRLLPITQFSLDLDEVEEYLETKLTYSQQFPDLWDLFATDVVDWVATASRGIPRRIEQLCHRAWEFARSDDEAITRAAFRHAIADISLSFINDAISNASLPAAERTAAKRLARNGLSTTICRGRLNRRHMRALWRLSRRDLETPLVVRRGRGVYEISDALLRVAFDETR